MFKVAIDAGHGGSDYGAVYEGRQEKNDNLKLAKRVGKMLENAGIDVIYTRDNDIYETPFKKATDANNAKADLFVSFHRNSSVEPNLYNGVETLIYANGGVREGLADNINDNLEAVGYKNLGIDLRPNLVVLKRTKMPAVLIEAGFINSEKDNKLFDEKFEETAQAIADAIIDTINEMMKYQESEGVEDEKPLECYDKLYRVQVGAFKNKENADRMLNSLLLEGFPAFIVYDNGLYKVQVGAFKYLSNAIKMESKLRRFRYNTYITT